MLKKTGNVENENCIFGSQISQTMPFPFDRLARINTDPDLSEYVTSQDLTTLLQTALNSEPNKFNSNT